jgi:hypothetical protein
MVVGDAMRLGGAVSKLRSLADRGHASATISQVRARA